MDDLTSDSPTVASALSGVGGALAGRYEVRARLGRGATKDVYLAYDERLDREVALAVVFGAGSSDAARARVAREAQVTGRLGDHPNVITVYDSGEHDGVPYLVLRAMSGGSLADLLEQGRRSADDTIRLGAEIAAALAHAHAHGVIHRDVKPDNVWLAADGSAALGDFGIAHLLGHEHLTADGMVVGTVRYPQAALAARAVRAAGARGADPRAALEGARTTPALGGGRGSGAACDARAGRRAAGAAPARRAPAGVGARRARRCRRHRGAARRLRTLRDGRRAPRRKRRALPR